MRLATRFALPRRFLAPYRTAPHAFGFGLLGELAYWNSYSRLKSDGTKEVWPETVERVVNGTFNMLLDQLKASGNTNRFESDEITRLACNMYDRMFHFKFLPPGRGLWAMGTPLIEDRKLYAALNNCSFVSTQLSGSDKDVTKPFAFAMDMLMLGTGVGFDTKLSKDGIEIQGPKRAAPKVQHVVADSREGYVASVRLLLDSYFFQLPEIEFDYSKIRPRGSPIRCFGGKASGSEPLRVLHKEICDLLDKNIGKNVNGRVVVDIMNLIGKSVITGNVRRSSLVAFGEANDDADDFISLKDYSKYPERAKYGWTSNNSIYATLGMDYRKLEPHIKRNGEPGLVWLENMKNYGRMAEPANFRDYRAAGGNPCLEQTLESYELCCLVELFPARHESLEDFKETLQLALLYAKVVTLGLPHWQDTAEIVKRNRRIGCSMTGIAQFLAKNSIDTLRNWCERGYKHLQEYDTYLSSMLGVPKSIKLTSIKPSGTVSLLAGATAGIHYPESRTFIRRVRLESESPLIPHLLDAGYVVEPDVVSANTSVVELPVRIRENVRPVGEVDMWEQLSLCAFMQKYWADNQISCTIKIRDEDRVAEALNYFQYQLKGISFLPVQKKAYPQSPIEPISDERYAEMMKRVKRQNLGSILAREDARPEVACETDTCTLRPAIRTQHL